MTTPRRWTPISWAIVAFCGAVQAISWRFYVNPDGVSYLNLSDSYARGDWAGGFSTYWSPLFPWLIGTIRRVYPWSPYWESTIVHAIHFAIYLASYACFRFMLRSLTQHQRERRKAQPELYFIDWTRGWEFVLAHLLFLWSAVALTGVQTVTPDMLLAAEVYLIVGVMIQVRDGRPGFGTPIVLGVLLGLSYLTKSVMFPVAILILACAGWQPKYRWSHAQRAAAALCFLVVAAPQVVGVSRAVGRPSFGENARIAYAWYVNYYSHYWTGYPPGSGTPEHPLRLLSFSPPVYEFATDDSSSSYPRWDNPAYWQAGIRPHFDVSQQLHVIGRELDVYVNGFAALFVGALILILMGVNRQRLGLIDVCIVATSVFALYCLVHTEPRLVAPWSVVLFLALTSAVAFREDLSSRAGVRAVLAPLALWHVLLTAGGVWHASVATGLMFAGRGQSHEYWRIASAAQQLGLRKGQRVASIGYASESYWARLAGVQIAFEIPREFSDQYWTLDSAGRARVHEILREHGAAMVIATFPPVGGGPGWTQLDSSPYYGFPLAKSSSGGGL